jgi:hypothetical protein
VVSSRWVGPSLLALAIAGGALMWRESDRHMARLEAELGSLRRELPREPAAPIVAPGSDEVLVDAIARRVAERVGNHRLVKPEPSSPSAAAQPPQPTAAQQAALDGARAQLDRALVSGRLSGDELTDLRRQLMSSHQPREADEILGELVTAMNAGRIRP